MNATPFHPLVARWFTERFGEPTAPQAAGWQDIAAGRDTLIAAPTGSGKTLTATASGFALGVPAGQYVYTWYRCANASDIPGDTPGPGICSTVDRTSSATSSS